MPKKQDKPKKKQRRPTILQYVEITDWLRDRKFAIEKDSLSQTEVTKMIVDDLNYDIALSTVISCAEVAKIKWAGSPTKQEPPQPPIDHESIIVLISCIHELYIRICGSAPQMLEDLKSSYVQNRPKEQPQAELHIQEEPGILEMVEPEDERG